MAEKRLVQSCRLDENVEDDCEANLSRCTPMDTSRATCYNFDNSRNTVQKSAKGKIITTTCDSRSENDMDHDFGSFPHGRSIQTANEICTGFNRLTVSGHISEAAKESFDSGFCSGDRLDSSLRSGICQEQADAGVFSESERDSRTHEQKILYEPDEDGDTQLHMAIIQMVPAMTLLIIEKAPNAEAINLKNYLRQTALHLSVIINQSETTKNLLAAGALLDNTDNKGNTALHIACKEGYPLCVEVLTTPVDPKDITCTYPLIQQSVPQDLELANYEGKTCLHLAAENFMQNQQTEAYRRIITHLLNIGAHINMPDGKSGRTILHHCAENGNLKLLSIILVNPRLNLNSKTYAGKTALMLALGRGHLALADSLKQAGAELPAEGPDEWNSSEDMSDDSGDSDVEYNDICINGYPVVKT